MICFALHLKAAVLVVAVVVDATIVDCRAWVGHI